VGIPPTSFARNSTDCTYQVAWLYEKIACERFLDAPAACRYRPAAKIASTGLYGSAYPDPVASTPYFFHVEGKNCIQPTAPALETDRFRP
jgi:hypothetical protein